ncbi:hypothetical protein [Kineococcus radiotolerans]|uniref:hypothetical protein n=1 Tax=Kineococcus radiotolerans TaxID=131568 RepID=UPI00003A3C60|nr:hypothetical protein [Kineococcus radiotolerans]
MSVHSEDSFRSQPLNGLPLPASTAAAVESLLSPRGRPTRGPGERGRLGHFEPIPEEAAAEWLGFAPPTLPSLSGSGFRRHFARQGGRDLVARADLTRGESAAVYVFYLPAGSAWREETRFAETRREGLTFLWLRAGYGVPWPEEEGGPVGVEETATIGRDPASGDFLTLTVSSTRVGVQYQRGVTRLAWSYRSQDADFNVTVMSGRSPRASVEMLVSDRGALYLG